MRNHITSFCAAIAAAVLLGVSNADAALDPAIGTTITDLSNDLVIFGGLVIAAIAIVAAVVLGCRLLPRVVKRVSSWF